MDEELLPARINDTAELCEKTCTPKFLGFLTSAEAALARNILKNARVRNDFFGGYEGAERVILGCFPDWAEDFPYPISPLTVSFRKADVLSHRDILGSLMALGIKRETVGDILIEEGRAVAFVSDDVKEYILDQVEKIGRVGVNITDGCTFPLPEGDKLEEFTGTAASDRIDCVAAALCGLSRSKVCELIAAGLITVNSVPVSKPTKSVAAGDVISVRGKGRYIAVSLDGRTKKDRIVIKYKKYIQEVKKC